NGDIVYQLDCFRSLARYQLPKNRRFSQDALAIIQNDRGLGLRRREAQTYGALTASELPTVIDQGAQINQQGTDGATLAATPTNDCNKLCDALGWWCLTFGELLI